MVDDKWNKILFFKKPLDPIAWPRLEANLDELIKEHQKLLDDMPKLALFEERKMDDKFFKMLDAVSAKIRYFEGELGKGSRNYIGACRIEAGPIYLEDGRIMMGDRPLIENKWQERIIGAKHLEELETKLSEFFKEQQKLLGEIPNLDEFMDDGEGSRFNR